MFAQRNRLLSSHPGNEGITSSTTIAVSPNSVDSRQQQTSAYCYCGICFWNSLSAEMQQKYSHRLLTAQWNRDRMQSLVKTNLFPVVMTERLHLFPSRTQKVSSSAPTRVAGRLGVKIGNANIEGLCTSCAEAFSLCALAAKRLAVDALLSFEFREVRAWRMLCA